MKYIYTIILSAVININYVNAQTGPGDDYQGRLYRLCKIWGYVKYYHSQVNSCQVNWDSILVNTIPLVKAATDSNQFNAAVLLMLNAAGPMTLADTVPPPNMNAEVPVNIDTGWMSDPYLSPAVQAILDTIRVNFRPHNTCNVEINNNINNYSYLLFPTDSNTVNVINAYPDEGERMLVIFRYWNILKYFNPNSRYLDKPWDSTLLNNVLEVSNDTDALSFYKTFLHMKSNLADDGAEYTTGSLSLAFPVGNCALVLKTTYIDSGLIITKSWVNSIHAGDIIDSIGGLSVLQWKDSMTPYISASNEGDLWHILWELYININICSVSENIVFTDSNAGIQRASINVNTSFADESNTIVNSSEMTEYKNLGCDIGYLNAAGVLVNHIGLDYDSIKDKPLIIIDLRNGYADAFWPMMDSLLPSGLHAADYLLPDTTYPGYFYWSSDSGYYYNPHPYTGTVILLINEWTEDGAEYACMMMQTMPHVIKIGSQTAGCIGQISTFNIGASFGAGYTSYGTYYPDHTPTQRIGIVPDIVVYPTVAGLRAGKDELLDTAIAIACPEAAIQEIKNENAMKLYPNPANNSLTVEISPNSRALLLKISNAIGCSVGERVITAPVENIDVSNLAPGFYLLNIYDGHDNFIKSLKWIKSK